MKSVVFGRMLTSIDGSSTLTSASGWASQDLTGCFVATASGPPDLSHTPQVEESCSLSADACNSVLDSEDAGAKFCVTAYTQVCGLLLDWSNVVLAEKSGFGAFASQCVTQRFPHMRERARDVLPLPLARLCHATAWQPAVGQELGLRLLNVTVAGLNYLFFGGEVHDIPREATALHRAVFRKIAAKLDHVFEELGEAARDVAFDGAFERFTSPGSGDKYPLLRYEDHDVLPAAALVDPMPYVDIEGKAVLDNLSELFPHGLGGLARSPCHEKPDHGDRISAAIALLRSGKLSLAGGCLAEADTFYVRKSDGTHLREVWNGGQLTRAARCAPIPPLQACPAALSTLEASADRPVWMSTRDGRAFFDQLRVPDHMQRLFGRRPIAVADLLAPPPCESGAKPADACTLAELSGYVIDGSAVDPAGALVPVGNTWPMGFGWSSYIAQSTTVHSCKIGGRGSDSFLCGERLLGPDVYHAVAVATDDINSFDRMSPAERAALEELPLAGIDRAWQDMGIVGHAGKATDAVLNGRVLGVMLRDGVRLQSRGKRLWDLLEVSADLVRLRTGSPDQIAIVNGHLQWQNLMNRPLYSCLHAVYKFIHQVPGARAVRVPDDVVSEILHNVGLLAYWSADLCRPWWSKLVATDASPAFGFGMSIAPSSAELTRSVAAAAADGTCVIRLRPTAGDPKELPRVGPVMRLPLRSSDFATVFSVRARRVAHSGAMQLEAVRLAILRMTRSSRMHGHRGVMLVDARAVGHALQKGRSSAWTLRRGIAAVAAVSLAADVKLTFPYMPSESNPADMPSRGKCLHRSKRHDLRKPAVSRFEKRMQSERRAIRRLRQCGMLQFL